MAITLNGTTGITTPDVDSTDLTATGNFTSRGIDDNATSTAMTLDSSGNLLVGTTSTSASVVGGRIFSGGRIVTSTTSEGHYFRRNSTDGTIVEFAKDGSTVGSIGVVSTEFEIKSSGARYLELQNIVGLYNSDWTGNLQMTPTVSSVDLGNTATQWDNLFLSGGVYLGGTGSANHLDDYESGTWTPAVNTEGGTAYTLGSHVCRYIKVGNLVHVEAYIPFTAEGSGTVTIISLPFTPQSYLETFQGYIQSGVNHRSAKFIHYSGANVLVSYADGASYQNYWMPKTQWSPNDIFRFSGSYHV